MSTANLIRWSGMASLLAGVLQILGAFLHPTGEDLAAINTSNWVPAHLALWVSAILILLGLVGLYTRQAEKTGWLGLAGFVLAFIGIAVGGGLLAIVSIIIPLIASESPTLITQAMTPPAFLLPVVALGFGLGFILFGVATMRSGVLPRWAGLLLIIGTVLQMAEGSPMDPSLLHMILTAGRVVFGLSFAWTGYALWSEKR